MACHSLDRPSGSDSTLARLRRHSTFPSIDPSRQPPPARRINPQSAAMSRDIGRGLFGGFGGSGGGGQRQPALGGYGADRSYQAYAGAPQGYGVSQGYGDPRAGHGAPAQRYTDKSPMPGTGRVVPLQIEKVADKTLQSKLIYGNMYGIPTLTPHPTSHIPHPALRDLCYLC